MWRIAPFHLFGDGMRISSVVKGGLYVSKLLLILFFVWLSLGWNVRRARKAFEKELMKSGMAMEDVERMGKKYSSLKDNVMRTIWGSIRKFAE